jgi:hypothetical protein
MRSSRASRVFRLIGTAVFVAFAVWFTVRSTVLAQEADGNSELISVGAGTWRVENSGGAWQRPYRVVGPPIAGDLPPAIISADS